MDWLNIAKSNQAKSKIRQWFKKVKKEENIEKGKELLEKELKKQNVSYNDIAKGDVYERMMKRHNIHQIEDLYLSIGIGVINTCNFVSRLKEDNIDEKEKYSKHALEKDIEEKIQKSEKKQEKNNTYGVTVKGLKNIMVRFAKCCNPVPGDDVLGYITKGRGVSIHRKDCNNLKSLIETEPEKIVEASFGKEEGSGYIAEIQIKTEDRMGILADIMAIITDKGLPLNSLNANSIKGNIAIINVKIKINSIEQLKEFMKAIRRIKGVIDVYRMNN